MWSLGVCASTACNLQTRQLCLINSFGRYTTFGKLRMCRMTCNGNNLCLLTSLRRRFSTTSSSSPTNGVRYSKPGLRARFSDKMNTGLHQHAAAMTSTSLNLDSQKKPDDRPELEAVISHVKEKQVQTPWEREGAQTPPVRRERSASAMTKGKLLTTPSRLLKLVVPVTTDDYNGDRKDVEPLALLLHPQQPLSYLERLIQAEVPPIKDKTGRLHPPQVSFLAVEAEEETIQPKRLEPRDWEDDETKDEQNAQKKEEKEHETQPLVVTKDSQAPRLRNFPDERNGKASKKESVDETESETKRKGSYVRWSSSTEIGDFIRDASRVKEFLVEIEGSPLGKIPVAVPSFNDRTYYLRMRLRKLSRNLKHLAIVKQECDILAQRGAQRVALGGLGVMVSWWYIVYKLTFETDYGWDTMEPITYLVSLSTLMGGYTWFLYHNREISYRSALDFTVSRRQQKLYQARGIDLQKWESLVEEANALRKEIKTVAGEYDVDWDERADEEDERVTEALKHERRQKERSQKKEREKGEGKDEGAETND